MKITKKQIRLIIREEIQLLTEGQKFETEIWKGNKKQIDQKFYKKQEDDQKKAKGDKYGGWHTFEGIYFDLEPEPTKNAAIQTVKDSSSRFGDAYAVPFNKKMTLWAVGGWVAT